MVKVGKGVDKETANEGEVLPKSTRSEVGSRPQVPSNVGKVATSFLLFIAAFALAAALGAGIAVIMEYFWGWPDTTWL